MAVEAFIRESVASPEGAMATIYFAVEFQIGLFGSGMNIMDIEHEISRRPAVVSFLSNYLTTFTLSLIENGTSFDDYIVTIATALSPRDLSGLSAGHDRAQLSDHGGDAAFAKTRYGGVESVQKALERNLLAACLVILRINVEKLLLLVHCLGAYKTEFEARPPAAAT